MATVIKRSESGRTATVRAFGTVSEARPVVAQVDPAADARAAMLDEIARLRQERDRARQGADDAAEQARRTGYDAGVAAADTRTAERLRALRDHLAAQAQAFDRHLDRLEGLAAALAKSALARIFDAPATMAAMVTNTLTLYVTALRDEAVLAVRVSTIDFADRDALDAIAFTLRPGGMTIVADPALPTGACRIVCGLDRIDLDIPQQWAALAALLDTMAKAP